MKAQLEAIRSAALEAITGAQAAAVYVALGFTRGSWGTSWWVFLVGGILCGAVNIVLDPYKNDDD